MFSSLPKTIFDIEHIAPQVVLYELCIQINGQSLNCLERKNGLHYTLLKSQENLSKALLRVYILGTLHKLETVSSLAL